MRCGLAYMLAFCYSYYGTDAAGCNGGDALVHVVVGDVAVLRVDADPVHARAGYGA